MQAYLQVCVLNKCRDYLDHKDVKRKRLEILWNENKDSHDSNCPESVLIAKENMSMLNEAIDALPEQDRQILVLTLEELNYEEIAKKLAIPLGSVGPKLIRAREKLMKALVNKKK